MQAMWRLRWGAPLAVLVLAFAACQPPMHPNLTVRSPASGTTTFQLLSGNGAYAVVSATAADALVPGAGEWRIDRATGATVALPSGTPSRISDDGQRIMISGVLWDAATVPALPSGAILSQDMTWAVFLGSGGTVQEQEVATGTARAVETAFPRPTSSSATPVAISDDGNTVEYTVSQSTGPIERFADVATGTKLDVPRTTGLICAVPEYGLDGDPVDSFALSPSGKSMVHEVRNPDCAEASDTLITLPAQTSVPVGSVVAQVASTHYGQYVLVSGDGTTAWVLGADRVICKWGPMGTMVTSCATAADAVALDGGGVQDFPVGPHFFDRAMTPPSGRYLVWNGVATPDLFGAYPDQNSGTSVQVIDSYTGRTETLFAAGTATYGGQMDDSGALVAAAGGSTTYANPLPRPGWFELHS